MYEVNDKGCVVRTIPVAGARRSLADEVALALPGAASFLSRVELRRYGLEPNSVYRLAQRVRSGELTGETAKTVKSILATFYGPYQGSQILEALDVLVKDREGKRNGKHGKH